MSLYESAVAAVVIYYAFLFLFFPHPSLRKLPPAPRGRELPPREIPSPESVSQEIPAHAAPPPSTLAEPALVSRSVSVPEPLPQAPRPQLVDRLRAGLAKTRHQIFGGLESLFVGRETALQREQVLESLFEILIRSDVGVTTTEKLVTAVRTRMQGQALGDLALMKKALSEEILALFRPSGDTQRKSNALGGYLAEMLSEPSLLSGPQSVNKTVDTNREAVADDPLVVMIVGVNGVGKTTTTGKLAKRLRDRGHPVVLGAADTFRAAAVEQLKIWADRAEAEFVTFSEGSDPASVAFETVKRGVALQAQQKLSGGPRAVCLVDTAGRLHNRKDLMEELTKVKRVMAKNSAEAPHEVLLVVDATTGQNAIQQAKLFGEAVAVNAVVLTKLDGTAKGGVALAMAGDLGLPIAFVGVGETLDDLQVFEPQRFTCALLGDSEA